MSSKPTELVVFVASPSDVEEERKLVRAAAQRVNAVAGASLGIRLRVTGWEEVPPAFGRPQGTINPLVDECDVFVAILYRRWGSETGTHSSGFEEEYLRAVQRREQDGKLPHLGMFFRSIPPDLASDAGPQLTRVMEFRETVMDQRNILFSPFADDREFEKQITDYLYGIAVEAAMESPASKQESSAGQSSTPTEAVASEEMDDARKQLLQVFSNYANLTAKRKVEGRLDPDRLHVFAASLHASSKVTVHVWNRFYSRADDLVLSLTEAKFWLRTMCGDAEQNDPDSRYVPGWKSINGSDIGQMLVDQATDENDARGSRGALVILSESNMRPVALWPKSGQALTPAVEAWSTLLARAETSATALSCLLALQKPRDQRLMRALAKRPEISSLAPALQTWKKAHAQGLINWAMETTTKLQPFEEHLAPHLAEVATTTLEDLARTGSWRASTGFRSALLRELGRRDALTSKLIKSVFASKDWELQNATYEAIQGRANSLTQLAALTEDDRSDFEDYWAAKLLSLEQPWEALEAKAQHWNMTAEFGAWLLGAPTAAATARKLLKGGPDAWFAEQNDRQKGGFSDYRSLMDHLFHRRAGLASLYLATMPNSERRAADVTLIRGQVKRNPHVAWGPAELALAHVGSSRDRKLILKRAEEYFLGSFRPPVAETAMRATESVAEIQKLTRVEDENMATMAMREMLRRGMVSVPAAKEACWDKNKEIRALAARDLAARLKRDDAVEWLNRYPNARKTYFYNVRVILDTELYRGL
ncbi:DUF4062 domain-containing protein [Pedococcus bigeumensis]|uniref:DUF4062 domain-containing protein n=1 Tax=Pedococcus bigeumensis TaxID=433644 RepID=UPI0031D17E0B